MSEKYGKAEGKMLPTGVAKVPFGFMTLAAMVLAPIVYAFVVYFVVPICITVAGVAVAMNEWSLLIFRPGIIRFLGIVFGSLSGVWAARLVCDITFSAYQARSVFYLFAILNIANLLIRIGFLPDQPKYFDLLPQFLVTAVAAYFYFWSERSPIEIPHNTQRLP